MSILTIYSDKSTNHAETFYDFDSIQMKLEAINVQFERWKTSSLLDSSATNDDVLNAYQNSIENLKSIYDFQSVDVIRMLPTHPEKELFRKKFLAEHTHDDFEVRFFVEGQALFYLHVEHEVYCVLCEQGDLISVPENVTHWFDMGENPEFTCIRFFTTPEGWVANFTGSDIEKRFPTFEQFLDTFN